MARTTTSGPARVCTGLAAGLLVGVLAACGGGAASGNGTGSHTSTGQPRATSQAMGTKVDVTLTEFHITLSKTTFTAGRYDFVAKNSGRLVHALEIEGPGGEHRTGTLDPGRSGSLKVTLKPGTYEVYCPVDGHKDLGMKTEITAR